MLISKPFILRPKLAMVISIVMLIAGGICLWNIPVAEYPEIAPPSIMVWASYPGASAEVIAETIAAPLESEINGVEDLLYYQSNSDNSGSYSLTITFKSGIDDDIAMVNVQNALKRAEPMLPQETIDLGIQLFKRSGDILAVYAFMSTDQNKLSTLDMSNWVSMNIKDRLSRLDGVAQAQVMGELNYSMRIWLDPLRMTALGITQDEVAEAIRQQNVQAAAGSVGTEQASKYMQYKLNAKGRLTEAREFANIVVRSGADGRQVRINDIARVELGSESYTGTARFNGNPCIAMMVYRNTDANAVGVVNRVNSEMEALKASFPEGMTYEIGYNSTEFIEVTMMEIATTLLMTLVLVILITWVFLQDWRATLIPALTIPVSIVGTFIFLLPLGYSANVLTMFALILVIGSVVDDAIVVVENCIRIMEEEKLPPREAIMKGMSQITGAVIATTLVILAIYTPIAFYGGMVGTIYKQFAVTMCIALCLSTVNALTLSPALCGLILRPHKDARGPFRWFNIGLDWVRNGYVGISGFLVRNAWLTILIFIGVLAANYYFFTKIPSSFIPDEDKGALFVDIQLAPGASLYRTETVQKAIGDDLRQIPGVADVLSIAGFSIMGGNGENVGIMIVKLAHWDERKAPGMHINDLKDEAEKVLAKYPEISGMAFTPPAIMGLGATGGVSFELQATGTQTPQELAQTVRALIGQVIGSGKGIAFSSFEADTPQLMLDVDRAKAEALQIPVGRIFSTLQSQLAASYINDFNLYGKTFQVKIQSDYDFRENINMIEQLNVQTNTGEMVPLSALGSLRWVTGPRQLGRFNQFMSANVTVMMGPGVKSGEMMTWLEETVQKTLPRDYQINWVDMSYHEKNNENQIIMLMALALVFGYLFLVGQYESWSVPSSVILTVAVATLGSLIALHLIEMPLSIYCQLGLIMLVGLSSKQAILMVEFSKQDRETGIDTNTAALNGARARFRAVMMTALSFVIGVLPMVVATGAGAGSRQAIGVTTFWGMIAATTFGLIMVPPLYTIFQNASEKVAGLFGFPPPDVRVKNDKEAMKRLKDQEE